MWLKIISFRIISEILLRQIKLTNTFIFGVFFYFYSDRDFASINPLILSSGISILIIGLSRIFISSGIMEFIHFTFAYVEIVLSLLIIYGCFRFKY